MNDMLYTHQETFECYIKKMNDDNETYYTLEFDRGSNSEYITTKASIIKQVINKFKDDLIHQCVRIRYCLCI